MTDENSNFLGVGDSKGSRLHSTSKESPSGVSQETEWTEPPPVYEAYDPRKKNYEALK